MKNHILVERRMNLIEYLATDQIMMEIVCCIQVARDSIETYIEAKLETVML